MPVPVPVTVSMPVPVPVPASLDSFHSPCFSYKRLNPKEAEIGTSRLERRETPANYISFNCCQKPNRKI